MTAKLRLPAGGTALALGLWALTAATAAPPVPKGSFEKAIDADVAAIQKLLNGGKPDKRAFSSIKGVAMYIAMYGEGTGNAALTAQAVKVAELAAKKDWAAADAAAKELTAAKAGGKVAGPLHAHKGAKLDLDAIMNPFRVNKVGGLNIEADLREGKKKGTLDAKAAEVMGARAAVIAEYTKHFPNDKASANAGNKADWERYTKAMGDAAKDLADAGAKKETKLGGILTRLENSCSDCHNKFRD